MKNFDRATVTDVVFAAVDEVNQQLRRGQRLAKSEATIISGESSQLDSLGLVNLIFSIEQKVEEEFGITLALADEVVSAVDQDPFRTIGSLSDCILSMLENKRRG